MSDVMFYGVLRMPYAMAMSDHFSRMQFYDRAQDAADRVEAADKRIAELEDMVCKLAAPADLVRRLLDDHQRVEPHHADTCALCREATVAIGVVPLTAAERAELGWDDSLLKPAQGERQPDDAAMLDWLEQSTRSFCGNYSGSGFRMIGSSIWHGTLREAITGAMRDDQP